jgi:hypothetical protein
MRKYDMGAQKNTERTKMSLIAFLAIFVVMLGFGISLVKIFDSRAIRVGLLSYLKT